MTNNRITNEIDEIDRGNVPADIVQRWLTEVNSIIEGAKHGKVFTLVYNQNGELIGQVETEVSKLVLFVRTEVSNRYEIDLTA